MDVYCQLVSHETIRELGQGEQPVSSAAMKAMRCLCLLLKAFTGLDPSFRQIKDEETFSDWEKIQQYLNSEQGE